MNKKVIVAAFVIVGSGVVNSFMAHHAITPVILGGYIFVLVLALLDMFGPPLSTIAGGLAMVAVVFVILNTFPWQQVLGALHGGTNKAATTQGVGTTQKQQ